MKRLRLFFTCNLFTGLFFCFNSLHAQNPTPPNYFLPQIVPRSPTATALEMYGTYKVNEYTGLPDISIPLYTVEAGGFELPITLSYHASGVKISDVAGWAGAGWSVVSGGQITRRVLGLPDDYTYGYLFGFMMKRNSSGHYNTNTIQALDSLEYAANNTYDSKPDIYSYDFPGHSGKFFFDGSTGNNYVPRTIPFAPVKIGHTLVMGAGLTKFNITDEHGNIYNYGDTGGTELTFSQSGGASNGYSSASAWKIENMISQNRRDTVSFTYQKDTVYYPTPDTEVYTVIDNVNNFAGGNYYNPSYQSSPTDYGNINATFEELPRQINFKNGKVVFDLDSLKRTDLPGTNSRAYGLKDIKVYRYNYGTKVMELQKTVVFYKSYFNTPSAPRLRLDSIQILDKAGSIIQHYRFDYNTGTALPAYSSFAQDYWGYYNGDTTNRMLTPLQTIQYAPNGGIEYVQIGQANRNPDSNYMQADVLTGIHYPSGGYSTFTYQTNQYDTTGVVALAGGLRVYTISSYDGISATPIMKTYVYSKTAAQKNFFLDYNYFEVKQSHQYYIEGRQDIPTAAATADFHSFSSNPHCDLEAYDAATVVYPAVTEYIGTPGTNIGRTDYTFSFLSDSFLSASFAGTLVYLSSFYERGQLISKKDFIHKADGTYQPVMLTTNSYTAFPATQYPQVGLAVKKMYYNDGPYGVNPFSPGTATPDDSMNFITASYDIVSDDNYLTGDTTKIYDTNDSTKVTTTATAYKYDNIAHQQVTRTVHTDSKGNILVDKTKFPADYAAGYAIIDSMVNRNMQAEAIEKYDTVKNAPTGVNEIVSGQLNRYKTSVNNTIVPSTISTLSVAAPLTNFVPSTVSSGTLNSDSRYVQMISFDQYDGNNNLLQYTPRNTTPVSIIWDYLHENPVAQVKNSLYYNTAYTSFEADGKGGWNFSGTPVFDAAAPTGTMSYPLSGGNITATMTTSLAYVLSLWSKGSAPTVTPNAGGAVTGTALNTVNGWTYYEYAIPAGSGNVTVSGTTSIDELRLYPAAAQMTTFTYDPSGIRSISDTKGMNNFFEYDYFQRLKNIRDFAGNIVKDYGYHYYDQVYGNQVQTASITRNTCPINTTPGALAYTVPANKYYSSTQASANAEAAYDMNTNGQVKANANCACAPTLQFIVHNTTSATFTLTFNGVSPYTNVLPGNNTLNVPPSTNYTLLINANDSNSHTYTLGTRSPQSGHSTTFTSVVIATGSSDLTLTIN